MPTPRTPEQNRVYTLITGADESMAVAETISQHSHSPLYSKSIAHICCLAIKKYVKAASVACALPETHTHAIEQLLTPLQANSIIQLTRHELAEVAILEEFDADWTNDLSGEAYVFDANDALVIAHNFRDKLRPLARDFLNK